MGWQCLEPWGASFFLIHFFQPLGFKKARKLSKKMLPSLEGSLLLTIGLWTKNNGGG
jgi:hypothetical protein